MKVPEKFDYGEFSLSEKSGIYLRKRNSRDFLYKFIKIEKTRSEVLKFNKAAFVVQSWIQKGKEKVLFSGMRRYNRRCYYGDNIVSKRKDFFVLIIFSETSFCIYYFKRRNPRNKENFARLVFQYHLCYK